VSRRSRASRVERRHHDEREVDRRRRSLGGVLPGAEQRRHDLLGEEGAEADTDGLLRLEEHEVDARLQEQDHLGRATSHARRGESVERLQRRQAVALDADPVLALLELRRPLLHDVGDEPLAVTGVAEATAELAQHRRELAVVGEEREGLALELTGETLDREHGTFE
jgi:hypothetical protein